MWNGIESEDVASSVPRASTGKHLIRLTKSSNVPPSTKVAAPMRPSARNAQNKQHRTKTKFPPRKATAVTLKDTPNGLSSRPAHAIKRARKLQHSASACVHCSTAPTASKKHECTYATTVQSAAEECKYRWKARFKSSIVPFKMTKAQLFKCGCGHGWTSHRCFIDVDLASLKVVKVYKQKCTLCARATLPELKDLHTCLVDCFSKLMAPRPKRSREKLHRTSPHVTYLCERCQYGAAPICQ